MSNNYTSSAGAAADSIGASSQAVYNCYANRAPISHRSSDTTYGMGNGSYYGHVKISNNYTSSAGAAADGIAASSQAVYNVYNKFNNYGPTYVTLDSDWNGLMVEVMIYSCFKGFKAQGVLTTNLVSGTEYTILSENEYMASSLNWYKNVFCRAAGNTTQCYFTCDKSGTVIIKPASDISSGTKVIIMECLV